MPAILLRVDWNAARVRAAAPQETVEEIVGKLWHCEERREDERAGVSEHGRSGHY